MGEHPDLIIDSINCEIKVLIKPEFIGDEDLNAIGIGKTYDLAKNICYDIGDFIKDRIYKGIKQADVIFADLSSKRPQSAKMILNTMNEKDYTFPELKNIELYFC